MLEIFDTPAVVVYYDTVVRNIRNMVESLAEYKIAHRPHIKVHKSVTLAKLQLELGAKGITCAKISEAEVMANAGITDILIANEIIGDEKCRRLMSLSKNADVTTLIDSVEGARNLNNAAREAQICCNVYVEVEIGAGRCGVARGSLHEFMDRVAGFGNIKVTGIMGYGGKIYGMKPGKEMEAQSEKESLLLTEIKRDLESWGYPISIVSAGSSYSSRYPKACRGITESRAGNYIFNDAATLLSGTCGISDCALRVIATVISKPEKGRFIIDAGSKALSSDLNHYGEGYGYVVGFPEMKIYRLNEEHGFVEYKDTDAISIGQKLEIIPNHACVISNLSGEMLGIKDGKVFNIDVSARGMLK